MRPKANPGTDGGGGGGRRRPRRTAWCASILLVVTTLVALNIVGVILRSAPERETTDQTYRRQMMARFYRGDPVRESGNQRETGNAIGVSGASTKVSFTPWVKRKLGCEFMAESGNGPNNARAWWQRFWEPCIACKDEERIGRIGDGGKWICDPQLVLSKPCSVLSVGSSNEFSFEREMVERFRCTIHIYDHTSNPPTPGVDIPAHLMHLVKFHRTAFDTTVVDEQTTTLSVMVDNLIQAAGTDRVDIFKIDCEGCEFSSFQSPENVQIVQKKVVQMQMEIHFGPNSLQQVSNLWFAMVNKFGMVPFHKEANIEFPMGGDGLALELAFLNQMYVKHEVRQVKDEIGETVNDSAPMSISDDANRAAFTHIYDKGMWGSGGGGSGAGSTVEYTTLLRERLKTFIRDYNIKSMIDVPCGAIVWTSVLLNELPSDFRYHGGDVVSRIVEANKKTWAHDPQKTFSVWDISRTPISPGFDFIFCRDALQHLPYATIFDALHMFSRSDAKYLLVGSYPNGRKNVDIEKPGGMFDIDLRKAPFLLEPEQKWEEAPGLARHEPGHDKYLYLYRISKLRAVDFLGRKNKIITG
ncbi:methyltransferase [Pycnococcus provasolii]